MFVIVFGLILTEIGVRIFASQSGITELRWFYINNANLGYSIKPDYDVVYKSKWREYSIAINSKGLRSTEINYDKLESTYRIIILGDSFTFGVGVGNNDTFSSYLSRLLNTNESKHKYEVINAGVSGYGTWEQLEWLKMEGYKYKPDLVVTAFCEDNDMLDNYMAVKAKQKEVFRREVRDGWLREVKFEGRLKKGNGKKAVQKQPNLFWNFIRAHSHLLELINKNIYKYKIRHGHLARNHPGDFFFINVLKKNYTDKEEEAVNITKDLLLKTSEFAKEIGLQYLVISIPIIESIDSGQFDITTRTLKLDKDEYDIRKQGNIIESFGLSNSVHVILASEFLNGSMYFPLNRHLNKSGNEKVAVVLRDYIISNY